MRNVPSDGKKSTGGSLPDPNFHTIDHQITFQDHTGSAAISAWHERCRRGGTPIAPPFSFQVYVTNGLSAPTGSDLPRSLLHALTDPPILREPAHYRLDVFFLPQGTLKEGCMAHYRAEKQARAGNWPMHTFPSYSRSQDPHVNFLIMVQERDWMAKAGGLGLCWFDPDDPLVSRPIHWIGKVRVKFEEGESKMPRTLEEVGTDVFDITTMKYWTRPLKEDYDECYEQSKGYRGFR